MCSAGSDAMFAVCLGGVQMQALLLPKHASRQVPAVKVRTIARWVLSLISV